MRRRIKINNKERYLIIIVCFILTFLLITGYSLFNTNLSINTKGNLKDKIWDFDYTGNVQTFIAPYDGIYQLELWGHKVVVSHSIRIITADIVMVK